jgi:hypothetical protein
LHGWIPAFLNRLPFDFERFTARSSRPGGVYFTSAGKPSPPSEAFASSQVGSNSHLVRDLRLQSRERGCSAQILHQLFPRLPELSASPHDRSIAAFPWLCIRTGE